MHFFKRCAKVTHHFMVKYFGLKKSVKKLHTLPEGASKVTHFYKGVLKSDTPI